MKLSSCAVIFVAMLASRSLPGQNVADPGAPVETLRVNSRAVLVDVLVSDHKGAPVPGLNQKAFTVTEQGNPQAISFFEEHKVAPASARANTSSLEQPLPNTFSNASPIDNPLVVNVLLLDALNTPLADQMVMRKSTINYFKSLKPGSRLAIFTLSMRLRFVQGFSDDPALLAAALGYRKVGVPEASALLQAPQGADAQTGVTGLMSQQAAGATFASPGGAAALQSFMTESEFAQIADREYRTLEALTELATFLESFPGRKNLIWLSGSFPLSANAITGVAFNGANTLSDARFEGPLRDTFALLAAARVSLYPVDARGVMAMQYFTAESGANGGGQSARSTLTSESFYRNIDYATMDMLAEKTGGKAYYSNNALSGVINNVVSSSGDFYTLSYTPSNAKMDGSFRDISVTVANGGRYKLSYRRGYFARSADLPAAAPSKKQKVAQTSPPPSHPDPLLPFMQLGMPQTQEIQYKAVVAHISTTQDEAENEARPAVTGPRTNYAVDFIIDLKDLDLKLDAEGVHHGALNLSLIVYDHYGQVATRDDRLITLDTQPNEYAEFQSSGVKVH